MKVFEITEFGVEINLYDRQNNLSHIIIIDAMDTAKNQLLAEILESSEINIQDCHY